MFECKVMGAINSNLIPIELNRDDAFLYKVRRFESKHLDIEMIIDDIDRIINNIDRLEALLHPIFQAELNFREAKLDKKVDNWNKHEIEEFENYFSNKYKFKRSIKK